MRQRLASENGPSPDTVVKACGKKIVLRWSDCVGLEKARSMCQCLKFLGRVAWRTRLGRYELTFPMRATSGRASCKKRTSNTSILSHPMYVFIFNVSKRGTEKKLTAPRMVDTSSCQSLMMFKYVTELEDLVNASPRRVSPGPRVRVSKRRIEPLREPVYTRHWSASQVGRDKCLQYWTAYLLLMQRKDITMRL